MLIIYCSLYVYPDSAPESDGYHISDIRIRNLADSDICAPLIDIKPHHTETIMIIMLNPKLDKKTPFMQITQSWSHIACKLKHIES